MAAHTRAGHLPALCLRRPAKDLLRIPLDFATHSAATRAPVPDHLGAIGA